VKYSILLPLLLCFLFAAPAQEFFDDFNYNYVSDTLLSQHGWVAVHGINAPPARAKYSQDLLSFESAKPGSENKLLVLKAKTDGLISTIELSRLETSFVFREGIFAARVFFDNTLRKTHDGNIQTFYLISPLRFPMDTLYSECDIEYLPYDIWHPSQDKRSAVYFSTWETYQAEPYLPDQALDTKKMNLFGWHILIITISNGKVSYYLDKSEKPLFVHEFSPAGSTVYPESPMNLSFANWISSTSVKFKGWRESEMKVDWVYHTTDAGMDFFGIKRRINTFQKSSIFYVNDLIIP
jgi:Glycosyl hydrolases family 16